MTIREPLSGPVLTSSRCVGKRYENGRAHRFPAERAAANRQGGAGDAAALRATQRVRPQQPTRLAQCGACTVQADRVPTRSCLLPVSAAAGTRVTTVGGGTLSPKCRTLPPHPSNARREARIPVATGEIDPTFARAARIVEAEYEWRFQSHAATGPACAVVDAWAARCGSRACATRGIAGTPRTGPDPPC